MPFCLSLLEVRSERDINFGVKKTRGDFWTMEVNMHVQGVSNLNQTRRRVFRFVGSDMARRMVWLYATHGQISLAITA